MPFAWRFPHGSTLSSSTGTCGSCTACCGSMGEKLERFSTQSVTGTTVEQRVLQYLEKGDAPAELVGMESATLQLRCSRRQLQRVLKKLCLQGKIEKVGKGRYRLAADGKSH